MEKSAATAGTTAAHQDAQSQSQSQTQDRSMWRDPSIAEKYREFEYVTGLFAKDLMQQSGLASVQPSPMDPLVILDSCCGTAVVSHVLIDTLSPQAQQHLQLTCGDVSESMLAATTQRAQIETWSKHGALVTAKKVDAQDTKLPAGEFTHVITNFGIMALPKPHEAISEGFRILKDGGIMAMTTWQTLGWVPIVQQCLSAIEGAPPFPDEHDFLKAMSNGDSWRDPEFVRSNLSTQHGFEDVQVRVITHAPPNGSIESWTRAFPSMLTNMTALVWGKEKAQQYSSRIPGALKDGVQKIMDERGTDDVNFEMVGICTTARKPKKTTSD